MPRRSMAPSLGTGEPPSSNRTPTPLSSGAQARSAPARQGKERAEGQADSVAQGAPARSGRRRAVARRRARGAGTVASPAPGGRRALGGPSAGARRALAPPSPRLARRQVGHRRSGAPERRPGETTRESAAGAARGPRLSCRPARIRRWPVRRRCRARARSTLSKGRSAFPARDPGAEVGAQGIRRRPALCLSTASVRAGRSGGPVARSSPRPEARGHGPVLPPPVPAAPGRRHAHARARPRGRAEPAAMALSGLSVAFEEHEARSFHPRGPARRLHGR